MGLQVRNGRSFSQDRLTWIYGSEMKKVILTGARGFIGRQAVAPLLRKNYEVHALVYGDETGLPSHKNLTWHTCDLLDPEAQKRTCSAIKASHLLHFAWYTAPGKYWTSVENLKWVQASLGLITNFAANGGKRAVMAGTCAEYDWAAGLCNEETSAIRPHLLYGACKSGLQRILAEFSRETGLSSAWGRIFFLYGPYEHPDRLIPGLTRALLQNKTFLCRQGGQVRDFLCVQDVASAFVSLLESNVRGAVNIASGKPVQVKDVVNRIADQLGKRNLVRFAKSPACSSTDVLCADIKRLKDEVGWRPAYTLEKGLTQTINWWKAQGKEK